MTTTIVLIASLVLLVVGCSQSMTREDIDQCREEVRHLNTAMQDFARAMHGSRSLEDPLYNIAEGLRELAIMHKQQYYAENKLPCWGKP